MSTSDGSTAANILTAALGHMRDRAATYDKPEGERSMGATVDAFLAVTGVSMTEEQGWLFMALLKAVRSQQGAYRADSYEDGAAYFALAGEAAVRDRNGGWTDKAIKAAALHAHPATFDHIDPADVEISEQSDKPGFAELLSDFRNKADAGIQEVIDKALDPYRQSAADFISTVPCDEPASAIDDDSERMQAIGRAVEPVEDYWNIQIGDLVYVISIGGFSDCTGLSVGDIVEVTSVDNDESLKTVSGGSWGSIGCNYKFHSRPSA